MKLFTPPDLHYPITITRLLRQKGDELKPSETIFTYKYKSKVFEYDKDEGRDVVRWETLYSNFESEFEGTIESLAVEREQVITRRTLVAEIDEPCRHETQYGGICVVCGQDMTTVQYNSTTRNTDRATVNTVHGHTQLLVSQAQASQADEEMKRRLLDSRKLSLVVDLDQTIIHATVDPTVAEWQKDPQNPNYAAVKDVRCFQLVDDAPGARGCWYYIKLRPGLEEFLQTIARYYELHIYTMGTRAYAENIAKIVDPNRTIFGERILSRDESGSMTAKNLSRLFPVDTKMVVIIDDRGDVWHWSPNLLRVTPYDFFVGIGDINSSFLPKRPEAEAQLTKPEKVADSESTEVSEIEDKRTSTSTSTANQPIPAPATAPAQPNGSSSAMDRLVSLAGAQDDGLMKEKTDEQEETIAAQLADRPLLQKQKFLDAKEEEAKISPAVEAATDLLAEDGQQNGISTTDISHGNKYRHNLLQDDDRELEHLGETLRNIHQAYFDAYAKSTTGTKGGRIAQLRPGQSKKRLPVDDLDSIPDVAQVIENMKLNVLRGVHIVFTGVIPMGVNIQTFDLSVYAKTLGASVSDRISKRTTHVIAFPERRTLKVRQAARRRERIHIVKEYWLSECFAKWKHIDEGPYRIFTDSETANGNGGHPSQALPESFDGKDGLDLSSSEGEGGMSDDGSSDETSTPADTIAPPGGAETEDELEMEKYAPTTDRDDVGPSNTEQPEDWDEINKELEDYLDDPEVEDSDDPSATEAAPDSSDDNSSVGERTPTRDVRKRKRDALAADDPVDPSDAGETSRLQKRKREALHRTTSLTNIASAAAEPLPTEEGKSVDLPMTDGDGADGAEGRLEDEDELDLEAALAAEMERMSNDEGGSDGGGGGGGGGGV